MIVMMLTIISFDLKIVANDLKDYHEECTHIIIEKDLKIIQEWNPNIDNAIQYLLDLIVYKILNKNPFAVISQIKIPEDFPHIKPNILIIITISIYLQSSCLIQLFSILMNWIWKGLGKQVINRWYQGYCNVVFDNHT